MPAARLREHPPCGKSCGMSQSSISLAAVEHYRSMAASLSDPRDVMVVRQYVTELEQHARAAYGGGRLSIRGPD
jgi:hypothetical protein